MDEFHKKSREKTPTLKNFFSGSVLKRIRLYWEEFLFRITELIFAADFNWQHRYDSLFVHRPPVEAGEEPVEEFQNPMNFQTLNSQHF